MIDQRTEFKVSRRDDTNDVSCHLEVYITRPHMRARARKVIELLVQDIENELFGDGDD